MLDKRILATLYFFDLQNVPLSLLEVHRFLLSDIQKIKAALDEQYEFTTQGEVCREVDLETVMEALQQLVVRRLVGQKYGFYYLPGRGGLVYSRLKGYSYGILREKRIRRFAPLLKFLPFVRGVGLAGSQAFGLERKDSDIDLLIITHKKFMWLARFAVTIFFHLFGVRRFKDKIANRFCLNHYIARIRSVQEHRNLYTAVEYAKLRPMVGRGVVEAFQLANISWVQVFFPSSISTPESLQLPEQSLLQKGIELLFNNKFGEYVESVIKRQLLPRIKAEKYIVVKDDELSFHPSSKQELLLAQFFESQNPENGETVQLIV